MKLVGLGAGILFLVFVAFPLLFVSVAFLWAIMGAWSIPVIGIMLFIAGAMFAAQVQEQATESKRHHSL